MWRAGVVVVLALLACAPVQADEFESYDPTHVEACIESAGARRDAIRSCVGLSANACIQAEGGATMAHVLCWSREADTWRQRMDGVTSYLNTHQTYRDPRRLASANAAWRAWAEAECEYWAYEEGGGSGEQVDRARCWAVVTADRAISLMELGAAP